MGLVNYMREKIRHFLQIENNVNHQITIQQQLDYYGNASKHRIWYRGDSQELADLYEQLNAPDTMFWKAVSTPGLEIRKIHTGLPKRIIDVLTNIVVNDFNGIEIKDQKIKEIWDNIEKDNKFNDLLEKAVKEALLVGDGAFKLSFDKEINETEPIIEFVEGENIEFEYRRGRITALVFVTEYVHDHRRYYFKEYYKPGCILYKLFDEYGEEHKPNSIPQLKWCKDEGVKFADKNTIFAVPVIFGNSEKYKGRGESIFEGKTDCFDALDETISQWLDALRKGRTKEYIPNCFLPTNPNTGEYQKPNAFDNSFIAIETDGSESGNGNKIYTETPTIQHESYLSTYITALDLCLQGIISPSTLGIDVKKLDNSEAQREKEKTTLYTRGNIIEMLNGVLPELVKTAVRAYQLWNNSETIEISEVNIKFGEYANPSFESQVETIGKARSTMIMSIEASIDELYGDTKDETWKKEEIARLKAEQGIAVVDETAVADDAVGKVGF